MARVLGAALSLYLRKDQEIVLYYRGPANPLRPGCRRKRIVGLIAVDRLDILWTRLVRFRDLRFHTLNTRMMTVWSAISDDGWNKTPFREIKCKKNKIHWRSPSTRAVHRFSFLRRDVREFFGFGTSRCFLAVRWSLQLSAPAYRMRYSATNQTIRLCNLPQAREISSARFMSGNRNRTASASNQIRVVFGTSLPFDTKPKPRDRFDWFDCKIYTVYENIKHREDYLQTELSPR